MELVSSRRYRLRCPLLRNEWKLEAMPGGEIGRFGPPRGDARMHVALTNKAAHEPFLALLILAAIEAILTHNEHPSGAMGP
jgi:hypothetical protein